jgi:uncharacterized protein YbcI
MTSKTCPSAKRLARHVAQATGSFENLLVGRSPNSVTIVADGDWMVVTLHESFTDTERRIARDAAGAARVDAFHRYLFDHSLEALAAHVRKATGVEIRGAIAHVDRHTGSVLKTFTTHPNVDLLLLEQGLGAGLPMLGVPVNAHLHARGACVEGIVTADDDVQA